MLRDSMPMPNLILYNYDLSPFSEKMRLMLGYCGLPWHSVIVAPMPPRPELDILTGGYRKIPVGQIDADVFCDTKSIASEIARLSGKPELAVENCAEDVQAFVHKNDGEVFLACVIAGGMGLLSMLIRRTSLLTTLRFLKDRLGIAMKAKIKPVTGKQALDIVQTHILDMENLLSGDFLFGDSPCIADFSAYMFIWFGCESIGKPWLKEAPAVRQWYERMKAFGHGAPERISADRAHDLARNAEPRALSPDAKLVQRPASIAPADYARDPVAGTLVGETAHAWILRRELPAIGSVHVHFPKRGYELSE